MLQHLPLAWLRYLWQLYGPSYNSRHLHLQAEDIPTFIKLLQIIYKLRIHWVAAHIRKSLPSEQTRLQMLQYKCPGEHEMQTKGVCKWKRHVHMLLSHRMQLCLRNILTHHISTPLQRHRGPPSFPHQQWQGFDGIWCVLITAGSCQIDL